MKISHQCFIISLALSCFMILISGVMPSLADQPKEGDQIVVSGAGESEVNGTYTFIAESYAFLNEHSYSYALGFDLTLSSWVITVKADMPVRLYTSTGVQTYDMTTAALTGDSVWSVDNGLPPAPTVSAVSPNAAPAATGVSITGTAAAGQTLTGTYTYADADNPPDEEGTSTFKWYRGTDAACAGKTEVGTAKTYTVADADKDKYLCFEVTPVAATGEPQGTPVMSAGVSVRLPGDVDGNGKVELADAVLALKIMAGFTISPPQTVNLNADVDGDRKIGMAEVVYILRTLAK